jgi:hypothetical protein
MEGGVSVTQGIVFLKTKYKGCNILMLIVYFSGGFAEFALVCLRYIFFLNERGRRAGVRCAVSDVGEEHHKRRKCALAQRRVAQ